MIQFFIFTLVTIVNGFPAVNPAFIDIIKVLIGSSLWIGGLLGYMHWREKNLKTSSLSR